jgi:hypothetical protein
VAACLGKLAASEPHMNYCLPTKSWALLHIRNQPLPFVDLALATPWETRRRRLGENAAHKSYPSHSYFHRLEYAYQHIAAIVAILQKCKPVEIGRRMNCTVANFPLGLHTREFDCHHTVKKRIASSNGEVIT